MRRVRGALAAAVLTSFFVVPCAAQLTGDEARVARALPAAFGGQRGAAVVLRVSDGQPIAFHDRTRASRLLLAPGSAIKPFTLQFLLQANLLRPTERMACRRPLFANGVRLTCSHADGLGPFQAAEALAFSCNTFFVEAARRIPPGALEQFLRAYGFEQPTGLLPNEAEGRVLDAKTTGTRELLATGAAGVQVTAAGLARAYLRLARQAQAPTASQKIVLDALRNATEFGLASAARPTSLSVAGKTGTAANPGRRATHAWFAGFAPAEKPEIVVVVYVEHGRGSVEAANVARRIFEAWQPSRGPAR